MLEESLQNCCAQGSNAGKFPPKCAQGSRIFALLIKTSEMHLQHFRLGIMTDPASLQWPAPALRSQRAGGPGKGTNLGPSPSEGHWLWHVGMIPLILGCHQQLLTDFAPIQPDVMPGQGAALGPRAGGGDTEEPNGFGSSSAP